MSLEDSANLVDSLNSAHKKTTRNGWFFYA